MYISRATKTKMGHGGNIKGQCVATLQSKLSPSKWMQHFIPVKIVDFIIVEIYVITQPRCVFMRTIICRLSP